jgi:hypothetical protein
MYPRVYRVGRYVYKNYKVYRERLFGIIKVPVDDKTYSPHAGVVKVNRLNGIEEEKFDTSHLAVIPRDEVCSGRYLVNFVKNGGWHPNHPKPASVSFLEDGRVDVDWDNGSWCRDMPDRLNFWELTDNNL